MIPFGNRLKMSALALIVVGMFGIISLNMTAKVYLRTCHLASRSLDKISFDGNASPPSSKTIASQPSIKKMMEQAVRTHSLEGYLRRSLNRSEARRVGFYGTVLPTCTWYQTLASSNTHLALGEYDKAINLLDHLRERPEDSIRSSSEIPLLQALGLAYFRKSKAASCLADKGSDLCHFLARDAPSTLENEALVRADQVHRQILTSTAPGETANVAAKWLLNLSHAAAGGAPGSIDAELTLPSSLLKSEATAPRFKETADNLGIHVIGRAGGAIMDDFNNDGWLDAVISSQGYGDNIRYLENNGSAGGFSDKTGMAGLDGVTSGLTINQVDYNNDGWLDIFVPRGAWRGAYGKVPNSLLRNNKDGTFTDVTIEAGLLSLFPTQASSWGDFDNDGNVDLAIANEPPTEAENQLELFRNNGDGSFTKARAKTALATSVQFKFAKAINWGDYDNDGWVDLYISSPEQSRLLRNGGTGSADSWDFQDTTGEAGLIEKTNDKTTMPFAAWFWDFDNDGMLDIAQMYFLLDRNGALDRTVNIAGLAGNAKAEVRLLRNMGNGQFQDVANETELKIAATVMGSNFGDIDNDGWLDLYVGTGDPLLSTLIPNRMFRNIGGRKFADVTLASGLGNTQKGHGISFGDFDNDGDQDILAEFGAAFPIDLGKSALYRNPGSANGSITLLLNGDTANRAAIGARVKVMVSGANGKQRYIHRLVGSGSSFGANSMQLEIGVGQADFVDAIEVKWPGSSGVQTFAGPIEAGKKYRVFQNKDALVPVERNK